MSLELKIKSKHLTEEAKIIRFEERKLKKQIRWMADRQALPPNFTIKYQSIHNHRVWDVRNENRATFLARAYLAGIPYSKVEHKVKNVVNFKAYILPRLFDMVAKYGDYKVYKVWNFKTKTREYPKDRYDELMNRIKDWLET